MKVIRSLVCLPIRFYQWVLSPLKQGLMGPGAGCRFSPSCSHYALDAIETWGVAKGLGLAIRRVARCHPWGGCGEDPVPKKGDARETRRPPSASPTPLGP